MTRSRWQQVSQLYDAVLARDARERAAFLADACAGDELLRREVESLLAHQETAEVFLEAPAFRMAARLMAEDPSESVIGRQIGAYRILSRLGAGGMGEVYRARDLKLRRDVAIKLLPRAFTADADRRARFEREARVLAALTHPNIATIHGVEESDDLRALVLELVEGETLAARLARAREGRAAGPVGFAGIIGSTGPGLPLGEALDIARQIADALNTAHEHRIIHRDLKPANIMLTNGGLVKVMDFGLAKRLYIGEAATIDGPPKVTGAGTGVSTLETIGASALTRAGAVLGTLSYMSPEQIRGETTDHTTDIFSLGIILYEAVAGVHPFEKPSSIEIAAAILNIPVRPLTASVPSAPPFLEDIIARMLAKDCSGRYQAVKDVWTDLTRLLKGADDWTGSAARGGVAGCAAVTSIVVMPTVLDDKADKFLAEAIPNTISKYLLKARGIETKRPPTTTELERVAGDVDRIVSIYGANAYVVSSVVSAGGRLTLSVQLVDSGSRRLRWSDVYEGTQQAYGEFTKQAAEGIRDALQTDRGPKSQSATSSLVATPRAELLLQRGLYHLSQFRNLGLPSDFDRAAAAFEQAADVEPRRSDALEGMALLHNARIVTGAPTSELVSECEKWVQRVLAIDSRSSKAWAILGEIETLRRPEDFRKPLEYGLKAASFGPRDAFAHTRLAGCLMMHSYELSLVAATEGARLDPLVLDAAIYAAIGLNELNRPDEALLTIDEVLKIEPDTPFGQLIKGMILADSGATIQALDIIAKLESKATERRLLPQWPEIFRDVATYRSAANERNVAVLDELTLRLTRLSRGEDPFPRWQVTTQGVTRLLARRTPGLALDLFADRALMGIIEPYDYLATHPELDPLREDVRFKRLLSTSRRNFEEVMAIVRGAQGRDEVPDYLIRALDDLVRRFDLPIATS